MPVSRAQARARRQKSIAQSKAKTSVSRRKQRIGSALTQAQLAKRAKRVAAAKTPSRPPGAYAQTALPAYTVAEVGDTWTSLADRLGVDQADLVKVNDTQKPSAGTAVNVPQFDPFVGVGAGAGIGDDILTGAKKFLQGITPQDEAAGETFYDWASALPGGDLGGGLQNIIGQGSEALRNLILGEEGGGGKVLPSLALPVQPPPPSNYGVGGQGATLRDLVWAENRMEGRDPKDEARARAEAIYEAQYGVSNALADVRPPESFTDPRGARPSDRPAYDTTPPTNEERIAELEALWESQKETFGRGGGIPGWIEERTGISGINPWDMSEEELAIFLNTFDTEELNYLESHGIIVPEGSYPVTGTGGSLVPAYGQRGGGVYPTGYGGYASQKPAYTQRPSYLGLTSWSI